MLHQRVFHIRLVAANFTMIEFYFLILEMNNFYEYFIALDLEQRTIQKRHKS